MENCWQTSYEIIGNKYKESYAAIEAASKYEKEKCIEQALVNYKLGIAIIDEALNTAVSISDINANDGTFQEECKMIRIMKVTRCDILHRVNDLLAKYPIITSPTIDSFKPERNVGGEIIDKFRQLNLKNIDEDDLIFRCEDVKLYYINSDGECTTTAESAILIIASTIVDNEKTESIHFLQLKFENYDRDASNISDNLWIYPLIPGVTQCFLTNYNAFIFPDFESKVNGTAYGLILSSESSADVLLQILETILGHVFKELSGDEKDEERKSRGRRATSEKVSENIVRGARYISQNFVRASTKAGEFVSRGTPYLLTKLKKSPENGNAVIPNTVLTGVGAIKYVTGAAANVTGCVAAKIGTATSALGRFFAPHVQTQGSKLLQTTMGYETKEASQKMKDVLTVTAGAVEGISTIYTGLEESAVILGHSISDNSVKVIEYKYGGPAGNIAASTFDTVGNVINFNKNMNIMTPKGLIKSSAKKTGVAIIGGYKPSTSNTNTFEPWHCNVGTSNEQMKPETTQKKDTIRMLQ